jgi:hypothetical protein
MTFPLMAAAKGSSVWVNALGPTTIAPGLYAHADPGAERGRALAGCTSGAASLFYSLEIIDSDTP